MDTSLVPTLESDTLLLRPWFQEFAEDFIRINLQPDTITNPCTNPGMTLKEAKARLKAILTSISPVFLIFITNVCNHEKNLSMECQQILHFEMRTPQV